MRGTLHAGAELKVMEAKLEVGRTPVFITPHCSSCLKTISLNSNEQLVICSIPHLWPRSRVLSRSMRRKDRKNVDGHSFNMTATRTTTTADGRLIDFIDIAFKKARAGKNTNLFFFSNELSVQR